VDNEQKHCKTPFKSFLLDISFPLVSFANKLSEPVFSKAKAKGANKGIGCLYPHSNYTSKKKETGPGPN